MTMRRIEVALIAGLLLAGVSAAQNSTKDTGSAGQSSSATANSRGAQAQTSTAASQQVRSSTVQPAAAGQIKAGSVIYAELDKSVDAKKAKTGDEVTARVSQAVVSQGKVVVPKGSKLIGHVTSAKAYTREQAQSELGIAFDHALLKNGTQIPLAVSIQAIGAAASASQAASMADDTMAGGATAGGMSGPSPSYGGGGVRSATGSVVSTASNAAGSVVNTAGSAAGGVAGTAGGGHLSAASHGAVGLNGLSLSASTSTSAQGSLITSSSHNVKLDSGTEMVLKVNP